MAPVEAPNGSRAETVTLKKMQGSWAANDIFNDMARDYAVRVNEMAGDRMKIDSLLSGAVARAFQVQYAVDRGVLDGAHTATASRAAFR